MSILRQLSLSLIFLVSLIQHKTTNAQASDSFINDAGVKMYKFVEQVPQFRGDLGTYLSNNLRYPDSARIKGIQGRVKLQFLITERGQVDSIKVLESVHPLLDAEAVRIVKKMPRWTPGRSIPDNKKVKVWYMLPITFALD